MENQPAQPKHTVTQSDIAQRCGLSQKAVSLALRGDLQQVSAKTIERVRAVAVEMGYDLSHHQAARRLVMLRHGQQMVNRVIALFLPPSFHQAAYFNTLVQGVFSALPESDFALVIGQSNPKHAEQLVLPPIFHSGEVDGILCYGSLRYADALISTLRASPGFSHRPVVSFINPMPGSMLVTADSQHGAYLATSHLLEQGHRAILHFFVPAAGGDMAKRHAGMCQAMHEYGLDPERQLHFAPWYLGTQSPPFHPAIPALDADWPEAGSFNEQVQGFLHYLQEHREITAIFAPNDLLAQRIGYLLIRSGLRIPDDISLIGFDDTDALRDACGSNILTTVRVPLLDMGEMATRLLIRRILGDENGEECITLPTELVVRGSTAAPKR